MTTYEAPKKCQRCKKIWAYFVSRCPDCLSLI
ncbi:MAG: 2,4-diacetylphloroglucinol biosynthesis protein [Siphoviridae sp. ctjeG17]|nr:MAG: 2,4-diacetylphloroglucinol biosynthesis protein [Siphoviridae sp. ctjeG17]